MQFSGFGFLGGFDEGGYRLADIPENLRPDLAAAAVFQFRFR